MVAVALIKGVQHRLNEQPSRFNITLALFGGGLIHLAPSTGQADAQFAGELGAEFYVYGILDRRHRSLLGLLSISAGGQGSAWRADRYPLMLPCAVGQSGPTSRANLRLQEDVRGPLPAQSGMNKAGLNRQVIDFACAQSLS